MWLLSGHDGRSLMCSNGQQRPGASALLPGDELELVHDAEEGTLHFLRDGELLGGHTGVGGGEGVKLVVSMGHKGNGLVFQF